MKPEPLFYSLDQVAVQLGLHVRTVRAYVRNGRLKAVRIGKQYRVARQDLAEITGASGVRRYLARHRNAEVSCVVQADAVGQDLAHRITEHLTCAVTTPREDGSALRVETIYDHGHAQLKVIVIGSLSAAGHVFGLIDTILET